MGNTSFEEAKEAAPGIGFGGVIPVLKAAGKAARAAWKLDNAGNRPHIYLKDGQILLVDGATDSEWSPTSEDLLAEDWAI